METRARELWMCAGKDTIEHEAVGGTQKWNEEALEGPPCQWMGGLQPGDQLQPANPVPRLQDTRLAKTTSRVRLLIRGVTQIRR